MTKTELRKHLIALRSNLPEKLARIDRLTQALRFWLLSRPEQAIGAYYPIKGEYDPLPALHRWKEDGQLLALKNPRRIGLPVIAKESRLLTFRIWYPGCAMQTDHYNIPKPVDTEEIQPQLLFVPCVGFSKNATGIFRLGFGGGFYDRTLAQLHPKPFTVGLAFSCGECAFTVEDHDIPLDAVITDSSVLS